MIEEIIRAPAAAKGRYILSVTLATSMGPGIRVDPAKTKAGEIMTHGVPEIEAAAAPAAVAKQRRQPPPNCRHNFAADHRQARAEARRRWSREPFFVPPAGVRAFRGQRPKDGTR